MKKSKPVRRSIHKSSLEWLPIDARLIPDIFSFSHVKGLARVFLEVEIVLSIGVVGGTFILALLKVVQYFR